MARIVGVDLPRNKRIEIALTYIYGIGITSSKKILSMTNIDPNTRVHNLTEDEISRLRQVIEKEFKVEGDLRKEVFMSIKRLIEVGSYRGVRHRKNLPARGQRTKTNARTHKGQKRAVGIKKKNKTKE
ncbi:MAG: 30S ribosomal protein S13 [bacterium]|nr:30S ribosomal protein S13 [bacterium]